MKKIDFISIFFLLVSCNKVYISGVYLRENYTLYTNVDNVIEIKSDSNKEIFATVNNGKLEKRSSKIYLLVVDNLSPTNLRIKQGSKELEFEFRTKQIPNPEIFFQFESESSHRNSYSVSEFQKLKYITPVLSNFNYACQYEIESYDIIKINKDGVRNQFNNITKYNFPKYLLNNLEPNDVFLFTNIKINFRGKFEKQIKIDDIVVTIVP